MAYNLQSLITILQQILNPQQTRWIVDHNKPQLQSLLEKSTSLKQILENPSLPKVETSLESQIRDAAHEAEDIIEDHMVDQMLSRPGDVSFTFATPDLQQVMQQLDSVMEKVVKLVEEKTTSSGGSSRGASVSHDPSPKSIVVGLDEALLQLKGWLNGWQSKQLEIMSIVGMGGIGKTTLALNLYNDPLVSSHFDIRAWITISQDYSERVVLLGLLGCITEKEIDQDGVKKMKNSELKDILYKTLYGRRYLIILDDMWSKDAWVDIQRCFTGSSDGSRILITTRESDVANYVNSHRKHEMELLDESESWDLLRQEVFKEEEECPPTFERIGRNIASNCGGLPLAIHVVGGLLFKATRKREIWENVANDVTAAAESDEQFSNILSLSYNHLPSHLRPCFLYMGAFPEDYEVKASRLIRLWVAEGFLRSNGDKTLEEEAEECLESLVGRNLVSVRAVKSDGRAKRYGIHDLMRDLCLKKAEDERFVHVKNRLVGKAGKDAMHSLRRVSLHPSYRIRDVYASTEFMAFARSFLCTGPTSRDVLSSVFFGLRLLRVLDILEINFHDFPTEVLHLVNLRYLAFSCSSDRDLSFGISRLCNLQTLVICLGQYVAYISLPSEIWEMAELRHLMVYNASFYVGDSNLIHEKLQTICTVRYPSEDFLHKIPNIKNLGISYNEGILDLCHLLKLEALKLSDAYDKKPLISPSTLRLPPSLRKLSLTRCVIGGEFMKYLCELPNLQVLKLEECEFEGSDPDEEWDATEQKFSNLQFLLLEISQLVHWRADQTNFPRLRRLVIRNCYALEEIPSGIGEIPTLQTIELDGCFSSVVESAQLIIEEQRDYSNDDLQLIII